ncbi:MAG: fasciclin domain-containing protein [Bacteroidaceae bacterium]
MNISFFRKSVLMALLGVVALGFNACKDEVDDSDLYTFTGNTITSYLESNENFSKYLYVCGKVKLSNRSDSYVAQLLSARGNYTVFAPTNDAVQNYLDSIYLTKDYDITQIPDSTAEYIVRNSIIDNGNADAYLTTDFLVGALDKTNMNDRYITVSYGTDSLTGKANTLINESSKIIAPDIEVSNGVIHGIDNVLQLSNAYLPSLIEQTPNLKVFAMLLKQTGWDQKMNKYRDEDYEQNHEEYGTDLGGNPVLNPAHRYFGYTAFVEPDSIFVEKWGIPEPQVENGILMNGDEIMEVIKEKCQEAYPNATGTNLRDESNAVNQFVSYHLLPERLTLDKLVIHHAEMGYAYNNPTQLSIDCFEYYETMCTIHRRLVKLTEGKQTEGKRINRHCKHKVDVAAGDFYEEYDVDRPGILIEESNKGYVTNALNGFYYTIDDILVYDDDVPNVVLNERLRWDVASLLPELMTNGYRLRQDNGYWPFPTGYFSTITFTDDCKFRYLPYYSSTVDNYQGDEFNVRGQYDMTLRLPPVPYRGTWEFRIAAPVNASFGMAQIYIGTNPKNLQPVGLPLDLRLAQTNPTIGWEQDTDDWDHNYENDKVMRNHGYMKPPYHDGIKKSGGTVITESMRNTTTYANNLRLRKIVCTGTFDPDEVWYIRVKSVMENTNLSFLLDYLEFCPKWVYSGSEAEDIW